LLEITEVFVDIRNIQKGGPIQANVHKSRLHSRKNSDDSTPIDVIHQFLSGLVFNVEFHHRSVFDKRNTRLMGPGVDDQFTWHKNSNSWIELLAIRP
jgi:hypothetical protein